MMNKGFWIGFFLYSIIKFVYHFAKGVKRALIRYKNNN